MRNCKDSEFLKAMHIEPCSLPEPSRSAVSGTSINCCVEDGSVTMDLGSFNCLLGANHALADELAGAHKFACDAKRDMLRWREAFWILTAGIAGVLVIKLVLGW